MKNIKSIKLKLKLKLQKKIISAISVLLVLSCFCFNIAAALASDSASDSASTSSLNSSLTLNPPAQNGQQNQGITIIFPELDIKAEGAILIEASTGTVLYEQNADEAFPPASVTKIMRDRKSVV